MLASLCACLFVFLCLVDATLSCDQSRCRLPYLAFIIYVHFAPGASFCPCGNSHCNADVLSLPCCFRCRSALHSTHCAEAASRTTIGPHLHDYPQPGSLCVNSDLGVSFADSRRPNHVHSRPQVLHRATSRSHTWGCPPRLERSILKLLNVHARRCLRLRMHGWQSLE